MKRVIQNFPFFVITFLFGCLLAPNLAPQTPDAVKPPQIAFRYIPSSYEDVAAPSRFEPEFRDLPNLDRLELPFNEKLIDLVQFEDGIYREDEVIAKNGEKWLVLVDQDGKHKLVSKKAKVRRLKTASWPGSKTDFQLSFTGPGNHIFAVKDISGLRPGKVGTGYQQPSQKEIDRLGLDVRTMEVGSVSKMEFNGEPYLLRVSTGLSKDGSMLAVLVLQTEEQTQVLYSLPHVFGEATFVGNLRWAGDLDQDGKLDLYFEPYNDNGGRDSQLYLSSHAGKGELVKMVSIFGVVGC